MTKKLYLASPLGFSPENAAYINRIKVKAASQGFEIFDPWEQKQFTARIEAALREPEFVSRVALFREISSRIGSCNEAGIRGADVILAVLDGAEQDAGTASEVGFGCALGKRCYGLRTDVRDTGDFAGLPINLQVLHFIERSGGKLFRKIEDVTLPF